MLDDYPILFDDEKIPFPDKWDESPEVVENTYETEAGTDQSDVVRYDKVTIGVQHNALTSRWTQKIRAYSKKDSIRVKYWDTSEAKYQERTMRIRNYKQSLIENSRRTTNTTGLYSVSYDLEEF